MFEGRKIQSEETRVEDTIPPAEILAVFEDTFPELIVSYVESKRPDSYYITCESPNNETFSFLVEKKTHRFVYLGGQRAFDIDFSDADTLSRDAVEAVLRAEV